MGQAMAIDPLSFEKQFQLFVSFVESKGIRLRKFGSHLYLREEEGYKEEVWAQANTLLASKTRWAKDKGTGTLANVICPPENCTRPSVTI